MDDIPSKSITTEDRRTDCQVELSVGLIYINMFSHEDQINTEDRPVLPIASNLLSLLDPTTGTKEIARLSQL